MAKTLLLLVGLLAAPSAFGQFLFPGPPAPTVPNPYLPPPQCNTTVVTRSSFQQLFVTETVTRPAVARTVFQMTTQRIPITAYTTATRTVFTTVTDRTIVTTTQPTRSVVFSTVGGGLSTRITTAVTIIPTYAESTRYVPVTVTSENTKTVFTTSPRETIRPFTSRLVETVVVTRQTTFKRPDITSSIVNYVTAPVLVTIPGRVITTTIPLAVTTSSLRVFTSTLPGVQVTSTVIRTTYRPVTETVTIPRITTVTERVVSTRVDLLTVTSTSIRYTTSQVFVDRTSDFVSRTIVTSTAIRGTTRHSTSTATRTLVARPQTQFVTVTRVTTIPGPVPSVFAKTVFRTNTITTTTTATRVTPNQTTTIVSTIQEECIPQTYYYYNPEQQLSNII